MTVTLDGVLEIDVERGVIYFHVSDPEEALRLGSVTALRICRLPTPVPTDRPLDVTHMRGADWTLRKDGDA